MTTTAHDDLEAVRLVVKALEGFDSKDQERIFRWAREKLGLTDPSLSHISSVSSDLPAVPEASPYPLEKQTKDIKSFVDAKNPQSGVQLAATVAYYYRFEAPESERKSSITSSELQEACRKANRNRLPDPGQTLRDAHKLGLLDRSEAGQYIINSVGENLVAMTLPQQEKSRTVVRAKKDKPSPKKKTSKKK